MLDHIVEGVVDGALGAADAASSMSDASSRKTFLQGCLLNLLGLALLIGAVAMLVMYMLKTSYLWLGGSIAAGVIGLGSLAYSYYIRVMRPSWEDLE